MSDGSIDWGGLLFASLFPWWGFGIWISLRRGAEWGQKPLVSVSVVALSWQSVAALACAASLLLRIRIRDGAWPVREFPFDLVGEDWVHVPDPLASGFEFHDLLAVILYNSSLISVVFLGPILIGLFWKCRSLWRAGAVYSLSTLACYVIFFVDPGRTMTWLLDRY